VTNLKQRAENMIVPHTHPYLTGQLLKIGLNYHSPGNFKIEYLNLSCIIYYVMYNKKTKIIIKYFTL